MARSGARTGRVTRVAVDGRVYVELADVAPGFEFGPVLDTIGDLAVGERVVVTALARDDDELVVIGALDRTALDLDQYATTVDLTDGLAAKAGLEHTHHADDVNDGVLALARLPVAPSGNNNATQIVRADDARLADARTPIAHTHDDRYYTEAEVTALLAGADAAVTIDAQATAIYHGCRVYKAGQQGTLGAEISPNIAWDVTWPLLIVPAGYRPRRRFWSTYSVVGSTATTYSLRLDTDGGLYPEVALPSGVQLIGSHSYPIATA